MTAARLRSMLSRPTASGQFLVGALVFMIIIGIAFMALAHLLRHDSTQSEKIHQTDAALNAAQSGVERAYWMLQTNPAVWDRARAGAPLPGYRFDQAYADTRHGSYAISISSASDDRVQVVSVGRSPTRKEIRAVKVLCAKTNAMRTMSVSAGGGVNVGASISVEWGSVMSMQAMNTGGRRHPQFIGGVDIDPQDPNGAALPNTDNLQWWSFSPNAVPVPSLDLPAYISSAQASGTYFSVCGDRSGLNDSLDHVYYFDCGAGTLTLKPASFIVGSLIVQGNLVLQGSAGSGGYAAEMPRDAWKQYGADWDYYRSTYDPGAPAVFPGLNGAYQSSPGLTHPISNVVVKGLVYVSGNLSLQGGGSTSINGPVYVVGNVDLHTSNLTIYHDDLSASQTTLVSGTLTPQVWKEVLIAWPAALP